MQTKIHMGSKTWNATCSEFPCNSCCWDFCLLNFTEKIWKKLKSSGGITFLASQKYRFTVAQKNWHIWIFVVIMTLM